MLLTKAESGVALLPPPSTGPQRAPTRWARPGVFRSVVLVLLAGAFVLAYRLPFFATQGLWTASIAGTVHIQASHDPSLPISAAVRTPLAHAPTGSTKTPASIHTAPTAPARTTQTERTGLLFQALAGGKPVPSDWAEWLIPQTRPAQIEALERLVQLGRTTPIDARLYRLHPIAWANQHARHGLLLLSDSGLESNELARLLDRLGATYTLLRMDADLILHDVLRNLSGAGSIPTLFAGTSPLGGLDAVRKLDSMGLLQGILHASDAL